MFIKLIPSKINKRNIQLLMYLTHVRLNCLWFDVFSSFGINPSCGKKYHNKRFDVSDTFPQNLFDISSSHHTFYIDLHQICEPPRYTKQRRKVVSKTRVKIFKDLIDVDAIKKKNRLTLSSIFRGCGSLNSLTLSFNMMTWIIITVEGKRPHKSLATGIWVSFFLLCLFQNFH